MTDENPMEEIANDFGDIAKLGGDAPLAPGVAIGAIALSLALRYHDMAMVKDGTMYQQYKLEGKNMVPIDLHRVFETAVAMETHLLGTSDRIANIVIDAITSDDEGQGNESGAPGETP